MKKIWAEVDPAGRLRAKLVIEDSDVVKADEFIPVMQARCGRYIDITDASDNFAEGDIYDSEAKTFTADADAGKYAWVKVTLSKNEVAKDGADSVQIDMQVYMDAALTVKPSLAEAARLRMRLRAYGTGGPEDTVWDTIKPQFDKTGLASFSFTAQSTTPCCRLYMRSDDVQPLTLQNGTTYYFHLVPAGGELVYLDVVREV